MAIVTSAHIDVDENGVARIAGLRTKVIQVVMDKMAHGWGPEEIQANYPHLSLAQVHAAFAYYYDHQEDCDTQIAASVAYVDQMRAAARASPVVEKLRKAGKLP
jgi:uncharacterized protein (DUF433 family)